MTQIDQTKEQLNEEELKQLYSRLTQLEQDSETYKTTIYDLQTALVKAEEETAISKAIIAAVDEALQDMIFIVDKEDRIKYVNSFAAKQFKRKPQELIGKKRAAIFPSQVSESQGRNLQKAMKTGKPIYVEGKAVFPNNRETWLGTWLIPLKDKNGEIKEIMGASRDITDRVNNEKSLQASEEKYRNLVDNAVVGVYQTNLKGELLYANGALVKMLEFDSSEELKAEGVVARYKNKEDRAALIETLKKQMIVDNFETQLLTKANKTLHVILSGRLDNDVISGMIRDISSLKRVEVNLKQTVNDMRGRNKKLAALNIIANETSILRDINEILEKSLDIIMSTVDFDAGTAHLFDSQKKLGVPLVYKGLSPKLLEWVNKSYVDAINKGSKKKWASPQAVQFKKPVVIEDIRKAYSGETLEIIAGEGIRSVVAIPLTSHHDCLGIIVVACKKEKILGLFDMDFLDSVGKHVGMAISTVTLLK